MPSRRRLLTAFGAATVALAGCSSSSDPGPPATGDPTASPTATRAPTPGPPEVLTGSWTHDAADAGATFHVPVSPPAPERAAWSLTYPASTVLVADSLLFVGAAAELRIHDAATGTLLDARSFAGTPQPTAVVDDTLFVTERRDAGQPTAHAVIPGGDALWSRDGLRLRRVDPGAAFGVLEDDKSLVALDAATGEERWRLPVADLEATVTRVDDLALGPDRLYVAGHNSGSAVTLVALDRTDGTVSWTGTAPNHGSAVTVGEHVLSGGFYGTVRAWTRDGERAWTASTPPPVRDVGAANGRAFVSAHGAHDDEPTVTVWSDGERLWARDRGRVVALAEDVAFVGDGDRLVALAAGSGEMRWERSFEEPVTGVLPVEAGLFVETASGEDERRLRLLV